MICISRAENELWRSFSEVAAEKLNAQQVPAALAREAGANPGVVMINDKVKLHRMSVQNSVRHLSQLNY